LRRLSRGESSKSTEQSSSKPEYEFEARYSIDVNTQIEGQIGEIRQKMADKINKVKRASEAITLKDAEVSGSVFDIRADISEFNEKTKKVLSAFKHQSDNLRKQVKNLLSSDNNVERILKNRSELQENLKRLYIEHLESKYGKMPSGTKNRKAAYIKEQMKAQVDSLFSTADKLSIVLKELANQGFCEYPIVPKR